MYLEAFEETEDKDFQACMSVSAVDDPVGWQLVRDRKRSHYITDVKRSEEYATWCHVRIFLDFPESDRPVTPRIDVSKRTWEREAQLWRRNLKQAWLLATLDQASPSSESPGGMQAGSAECQ